MVPDDSLAGRALPDAARDLVAGIVDYAGLFPPAALPMPDAVAAYADYLGGPDTFALGRFVVPVARLDEFLAARRALPAGRASLHRWRLSALAGPDVAADAARIVAFNVEHVALAVIDSVEAKLPSADPIRQARSALPPGVALFAEIPVAPDPRALIEAIRAAGAGAKIRTGGVTVDAFPDAEHVARFIARCLELGVPFKATAGLHHPIAGDYRLTYEANPPVGRMFGFVNVLLATAILAAGGTEPEAAAALAETDRDAMRITAAGLRWRRHSVSIRDIASLRDRMLSFGSCSFREPIDELPSLVSHAP